MRAYKSRNGYGAFMAASSYLRHPHLAHDLLTFIAEDDVWLVPVSGGRASRLTSDRVPVTQPRLSPDARHVAWTSSRDGTAEAYAVAVDGGAANRLTYWGERTTLTSGWLSADEVLVLSANSHRTTRRRPWAYAVSLAGATRALPYGSASGVAVAPDGATLLSSASSTPQAWRKRYLGGRAGRIWLDPDGGGEFAPFLGEVGGSQADAMFVGDRIAFVSDHEGIGALYSTTRDGDDLRRHTELGTYYARNATTDGTRIVYHRAGELWLLPSLDAEPEPIPVTLGGARTGRSPFPVSAETELHGLQLDRTGRIAAAEVRGTIHWLPVEDGPARALLAEPGVRGRLPVVVPGKSAVLCVSDAGGEDGLDLIPADGAPARRIGHGLLGQVFELAVSPDGKTAAVSTEDGRLLLINLDDERPGDAPITELARDELHEPHDLAFSPDSAHLAWSQPWSVGFGTRASEQIHLARLADRTITDVTGQRFHSFSPTFTRDGKYLAFLSNQSFDPVYDAHLFDLSFLPGIRPYLVTLARDTPSPFAPELSGRPATQRSGHGSGKDEAAEDSAPEPVRVDPERIDRRIVPFPVEAGEYSDLRAIEGGVAWLSRFPLGELGEAWRGAAEQPPKTELVRYDLGKRKRSVLVAELDSYAVSGDGRRIAFRTGGALKVKASDAADRAADKDTIAVDLDRIRVQVDPVAEWRQMYQESWRLTRDNFWRPDMGGLDWAGMADRYRPLLDRIGSPDDFVDLLWELQGELATSHAYVVVPVPSAPAATRQGLLGADLAPDPDGTWRIVRILPGESSVAEGRSPLEAPGVAAEPGDAITAVDGRPVDPVRGPAPLLAGKAGKPVELTLRPGLGEEAAGGAAAGEPERRIVVVPLASEEVLRYQDLIATRRAKVHELSGGRLGYLHAPNMMAVGWAEFHRDFATEIHREGLIFDLRENGGGHTSQLVIEKLTRKIIGWCLGGRSGTVTYPSEAARGPVVTLIDEMAGSDGDIAAHAVRAYGIGPLVGTRTWGGVVGIDRDRRLADGTEVTQPKLAIWFEGLGFGVENYGVDPDVEVLFPPQDRAAGRDPQLATGVRMALEALETHPAVQPPSIPPLPDDGGTHAP